MKYPLFVSACILTAVLSGCAALPSGDPPDDLTGAERETLRQTQASAESAMAVSLTRFALSKQLTPVSISIFPRGKNEMSFLRSLDRNVFKSADEKTYEYLLVSKRIKNTWTLSLKKRNGDDFLWIKTIENISDQK